MAARSTFKISEAVRDVLACSTITDKTVTLPPGQLDRKLYLEVNKALEGAGGAWDTRRKLHVFERDPREMLGLAVKTGDATRIRTVLQSFYTPDALADRLVAATDITTDPRVVAHRKNPRKPGSRPTVLEPSIGRGALALAVIRATGGHVWIDACDIDPVACEAARAAIAAAFKTAKARRGATTGQVYEMDFLQVRKKDSIRYDYIVMNPPFQKEAGLKHVLHAWSLLNDGGILASVVWPGYSYSTTSTARSFRALVDEFGEVEDIPGGTFEHTDSATVMIVLRKPAPPQDE